MEMEIVKKIDSAVLKKIAAAIRELQCRRGLTEDELRFVETIEMITQFDTVSLADIVSTT